jgi:hypothetical protein
MKINRLSTPITIALAFACLANNRALAQPACVADFTDLGQGKLIVEIKQRSDGLFDASMNGTISSSGGQVLFEAFDTAGLSLGKVVRILVTVSCQ